jgi:hypothetical protein
MSSAMRADASDDAIRSLIISHTQAALALMSGL